MSAPGTVTVRAPAKVNLGLSVGPLRADGYHELASVFHAVNLCDEVRASHPSDDEHDKISVHVIGDSAELVPLDDSNLAVRAARALAEYAGASEGVTLRIRKGIPVAGGMAGGSADAAATLIACDALWGTGLGREELHTLAGRLGADVPFSLLGGTAIGTGRGEHLTPALARGSYSWVFALADTGLSTPTVYAELDRLRGSNPIPRPRVPDDLMAALRSGKAEQLGPVLRNDLERAAVSLSPHLRFVLDSGLDLGALGAVVSGSGPTVAFLAGDDEHAIDLAVGLTATGVSERVKRATGPAVGARVISG